MRRVTTAVALLVLAAAALAASGGCQAPGVAPYGDGSPSSSESAKLPDRQTPATTAATDSGTAPPTDTRPRVAVSLIGNGLGAITSTPGGMTCTKTDCTARYAPGTKITLLPTPVSGSIFGGWTGSECTGSAQCAPTVTGDIALVATFDTFDGTWSGPFDHHENNGCQFDNVGTLSVVVTSPPAADAGADAGTTSTIGTTAAFTGMQLRTGDCQLLGVENGTAADPAVTVDGTKLSGNWAVSIPNAAGTLPLPFTATVSGHTLTGTWSCAGCTGNFTLTKQ